MAITYRRGTLEDVELLIRLREQGVREMNNLDETADLSRLERENRRYYRQALADDSYVTFLAMDGQRAVGVGGVCLSQMSPISANPTGLTALLISIYTHPDYRRRGIGQALIDRLLQAAREAGAGLVLLESTPIGRPLYEKNGFRPLSTYMGRQL